MTIRIMLADSPEAREAIYKAYRPKKSKKTPKRRQNAKTGRKTSKKG